MSRRSKKKEVVQEYPDMSVTTVEEHEIKPVNKSDADIKKAIDIANGKLELIIEMLENNGDEAISQRQQQMVIKSLKQISSYLRY